MGKGDFLGEFEQMVLLSVLRLRDDAYGVSIHRELEERTGRAVRRGAVFVALERLQTKEFVSSTYGDPTSERGGRAKRYYTVEPAGRAALRSSREALMSLWDGVEPELEEV